MNNLVKFLLLSTVFLLPLIGAYQNFGYEHTKVLFFIVLMSLIGLFLIREKLKWSLISQTAGLLIIILLITSLIGINSGISLLGTQPYFQGLIVYAYLYLFFLAISWSKIKFEHWALCLVGSASLVGLLAIKDWVLLNILNFQIPTYAGRIVSTFGQPNFYAGFILLSLPFFYYLLTKRMARWWMRGGFLISSMAIIISQSRTAQFLLSGLMMIWLIKERRFVLAILVLIIFSSLVFSTGLFWQEIIKPHLTTNPDLTKSSVENRVYIWPVAWQLVLQKPLTGYGLENIGQAFQNYFTVQKHALFEENLNIDPVLISLKELNIDRSHNYLLDLLLFSGIFGLLAWFILVIMLIKKLLHSPIKLETTALLIGLITYLIWIQFQNQSVVHLIYFWLLAGLIDHQE